MGSVRQTSLEAYQHLKDSGKGELSRTKVLKAIIDAPCPVSRNELVALARMPINGICGRVAELIADGLIIETEKKPCRITGRNVNLLTAIKDENTSLN